MLKPPDFSDEALWQQHFRTRKSLWAQLAAVEPQRELVCTNASGVQSTLCLVGCQSASTAPPLGVRHLWWWTMHSQWRDMGDVQQRGPTVSLAGTKNY
jgi:hypothetical protein